MRWVRVWRKLAAIVVMYGVSAHCRGVCARVPIARIQVHLVVREWQANLEGYVVALVAVSPVILHH